MPIYFFRQHMDFNKSHSKLQVVPGNTVWKTFGMVIIKYVIIINIIYLTGNSRLIYYYLCHQQITYFWLHSAKLHYQQDDTELARLELGCGCASVTWIGGVANLGRWLERWANCCGPRSNHSATITMGHRRSGLVQP